MKKVNFNLYIFIVSIISATTVTISIFVKDKFLSESLFHAFVLMLIIENILYWFYVKQLKSK